MTNPNEAAFVVNGICKGLTKREYYAGLAMQGLMSVLIPTTENQLCPNQEGIDFVIGLSVRAADALIAELNKEPK